MTRAERARLLEDEELVPKRSARLAAKSKYKAARPEAQARKVTMKRLGMEVDTELPDEASFEEFHSLQVAPFAFNAGGNANSFSRQEAAGLSEPFAPPKLSV